MMIINLSNFQLIATKRRRMVECYNRLRIAQLCTLSESRHRHSHHKPDAPPQQPPMSWFRTIADSLGLEEDDEDEETNAGGAESPLDPKPEDDEGQNPQSSSSSSSPTPTARGVKEDFSELTKTFTNSLWGVASFLASPSEPPQISDPQPDPPDREASEEAVIAGIRSDFAEISGRVKLGISKLSSNIGVSEISKIASNFLQIGSEEEAMEKHESVGVTEEVLAFVNIIAMNPETWLDFPVPREEEDEFDEFDMSDAQQEHALAVVRLVPRFAALRLELCPEYMSDGRFWKIYFVLLHPRLDKNIALLLSTPQITEARALLTPDSQKDRTKSSVAQTVSSKEAAPSTAATHSDMDKRQVIDESIIEEKPASQVKPGHSSSEDENDEWLKQDVSETSAANRTSMPVSNDEDDVSFSDLEDNENDGEALASYKKDGSDSSAKDSQEWVQLGRSSTDSAKDAISADTKRAEQVSSSNNDWLDVNDIDSI